MPGKLTGWQDEAYNAAWTTALVGITDYAVRTLEQPDQRLEGELLVLAARHRTPDSPITHGFRLAAAKLMWAASIRLQEKTVDAKDRLERAASGAEADVAALIRAALECSSLPDLIKVVGYPSDGEPVTTPTLVLAATRVVQAAMGLMAHPLHSSTADLWAELGWISASVGWH